MSTQKKTKKPAPVKIKSDRVEPVLQTMCKAYFEYMKSERFQDLPDAQRVEEAWNIAEALNTIAEQSKPIT